MFLEKLSGCYLPMLFAAHELGAGLVRRVRKPLL